MDINKVFLKRRFDSMETKLQRRLRFRINLPDMYDQMKAFTFH